MTKPLKQKYLKYQKALNCALETVPQSPCVEQLNAITSQFALAWFSPIERACHEKRI